MESLINELKENKVLKKEDVISLRNHINEANPYADSKKKASLLAVAIYKTIDGNLEGFSDKYKQRIRQRLIKSLAYENKELLDKSDIFFTCTSFENDSSELLEDLTKWVNQNVKSIIKKEVINEYIKYNPQIAIVDLKSNEILDKKKKNHKKLIHIKDIIYNNISSPKDVITICIVILLILLVTIRAIVFLQNQFSGDRYAQQAFKISTNSTSIMNRNNLQIPEDVQEILYESSSENSSSHIPHEFKYKNINQNKLKDYLKTRNSILEEEPYFTAIILTAKDFNLNPIVLFSITGQEQGFVPRSHGYAEKIANNPFNVFGSWKKYNTNIKDSTEVAARTVSNLLKEKPDNIDAFKWINRKYAEDKRWWIGVRSLFDQIEDSIK